MAHIGLKPVIRLNLGFFSCEVKKIFFMQGEISPMRGQIGHWKTWILRKLEFRVFRCSVQYEVKRKFLVKSSLGDVKLNWHEATLTRSEIEPPKWWLFIPWFFLFLDVKVSEITCVDYSKSKIWSHSPRLASDIKSRVNYWMYNCLTSLPMLWLIPYLNILSP